METNCLVYLIFLSQIILISYYYPKKIGNRIKHMLHDYPASTHPKLYPQSEAKLLSGHTVFKWLNWAVLLVGSGVFAYVLYVIEQQQKSIAQLAFVPMAYGLIQAIPYVFLELSNFKQLKIMRELVKQTKRQAELTPRHLFDFIGPVKFFTAVLLFIICVISLLYFEHFTLTADLMVLLGSMILANGLFIFVTLHLLYGKKMDPHQSASDRAKVIRANLNSFVYTSILISVYFMLNKSVDAFNWQSLEIIFNSLYWQLVIILSTGSLLRGSSLQNINYDVYRA